MSIPPLAIPFSCRRSAIPVSPAGTKIDALEQCGQCRRIDGHLLRAFGDDRQLEGSSVLPLKVADGHTLTLVDGPFHRFAGGGSESRPTARAGWVSAVWPGVCLEHVTEELSIDGLQFLLTGSPERNARNAVDVAQPPLRRFMDHRERV